MKNVFAKIYAGVKSQVGKRASRSENRAVQTGAAIASLLPYTKYILIGGLIIVVLFLISVSLSGAQKGVETLTLSLSGCDDIPTSSQIDKYLQENNIELSEEERESLNVQNTGNACKKQGDGFNGLGYPPTEGTVTVLYGVQDKLHPNGHSGMDISSSCDTPIYAFAGGEVTSVVDGTESKSTFNNYIYPMGSIVIKHNQVELQINIASNDRPIPKNTGIELTAW